MHCKSSFFEGFSKAKKKWKMNMKEERKKERK